MYFNIVCQLLYFCVLEIIWSKKLVVAKGPIIIEGVGSAALDLRFLVQMCVFHPQLLPVRWVVSPRFIFGPSVQQILREKRNISDSSAQIAGSRNRLDGTQTDPPENGWCTDRSKAQSRHALFGMHCTTVVERSKAQSWRSAQLESEIALGHL